MAKANANDQQQQLAKLLRAAGQIAQRAGDLVMELYEEQAYQTYQKADESPVTSADLAAHKYIVEQLQHLDPSIPILSEEGAHIPLADRQQWQRYWLIDPIDGTQEFIARSGDFGVVIALLERTAPETFTPTLGIIYWPFADKLYLAQRGKGGVRIDHHGESPLQVRAVENPEQDMLTLAISRRQPRERVLQRMNPDRDLTMLPAGSCSLKACLIAEGQADCFLRVGPTGEWDTAAAEVIVVEAGGRICSEHFTPISYNQEKSLGNPNFLILGDTNVDWQNVFIYHRTHQLA